MSATRKCYQCGDEDLAAVQEARKAQIRAHADKLAKEADKAFAKELKADPKQANEVSDWDILNTPLGEEQPKLDVADQAIKPHDALAATDPQPVDEENAAKVAASPKPEGQAVDSTKDAEDNRDSSNVTAKAADKETDEKADKKAAPKSTAKAKKDADDK